MVIESRETRVIPIEKRITFKKLPINYKGNGSRDYWGSEDSDRESHDVDNVTIISTSILINIQII